MASDGLAGLRYITAFGVPVPLIVAAVAAGTNLAMALIRIIDGGDPIGYLNATVLAFGWVWIMVVSDE